MSTNMREAWKSINSMSNFTKKTNGSFNLMSSAEQRVLTDDLNQFYTRFSDPMLAAVNAEAEPTDTPHDDFGITVGEVRAPLCQCQSSKAARPDGILSKVVKECSFKLVPAFCKIFSFFF